ncbi:transcription initiation factor iia small chain [Blastocladiella britannica]|nr:transcription initiation factor iia small chain [Blastocladiella britannica]
MASTEAHCHFRSSSVGMTLIDALDDLIQSGQMAPTLANKVLAHFDLQVVRELQTCQAKASFKGGLSTYRNCDDVWTFVLKDAHFKMGSEVINVDKCKIIACKSSTAT